MRKIIVLSFISLDGVMQAPGGPREDMSGGFKYGGWTVPFSDDQSMKLMMEQIVDRSYELLLGRRTYDIFSSYWPDHNDNPIGAQFNAVKKYVASTTLVNPSWNNTSVLTGDVVEELKKLKASDGPELQVHGSGNFVQTLLKNDLVDEMWLKVYPVTLGSGKKLFDGGQIPASFTLTKSVTTPKGVIFANYERAGEVETGSFV